MSSPNAETLPGFGRHQHGRQPEHVDEAAQQERAGTAERREREVADVEAAPDGDLAQRVGLVPRGDLQDAGRAGLRAEPEPAGEPLDAGAGRPHVERDLPAEQVRRDPPEEQVRVGDRDRPVAGPPLP